MISKLLRQSYQSMRRSVRQVVLGHPATDRVAGRLLRRLERRLGLARRMVPAEGVVTARGVQLAYTAPDRSLAATMQLNGDYEPETREVLESLLPAGGTFLDLGAHIGFFTVLAARCVGPNGRVFAFEPMEGTRRTLLENVRINGVADRVTVEPFATSDRSGTLKFAVAQSSVSNKMVVPGQAASETCEVPCTTLDEYFADRGWPGVDAIKADVEGSELATFIGMRNLTARNPDVRLIFELNRGNLINHDIAAHRLFDELCDQGFRRFEVLHRERRVLRLPEDFDYLDALTRDVSPNVLAYRDGV